jgi:hypothetical protein
LSFVAAEHGMFKTPSLRDVARRPPYMHDGSLRTLEEVVRYYDRGATRNPHLDARIFPLGLADGEVRDLVAFLGSLTGDERGGLGPPRRGTSWTRLRVVDLEGNPLARLPVRVLPAGDRLQGGRADDPPLRLSTDESGYLAFRFPAWTHVRLEGTGHDYRALIPDCAAGADVVAAPRDVVALEVRGLGSRPAVEVAVSDPPGLRGFSAEFRLVRDIGGDRAIYAAEPRWSLPWALPGKVDALVFGARSELDLSGGWTEPLELR